MSDSFLKFEDWEKTIADYIKKDPLWESLYYRVAWMVLSFTQSSVSRLA